jgi:D-alanyl-D-alanine carboxypeptidase/D-alanyl-D-alanine-endopeptidase (penicillin-binding protein 4)
VLAVAASAPLAQIVERMLTESDNDVAEVLARHVAIAGGAPGTSEAAEAAVLDRLRALGVDVRGAQVADGSGLSVRNRISPAQVASVLQLAADPGRPALGAVITGLPVAGFSGTLDDRFPERPATRAGIGAVRAKTGTLTGVTGLAGVVTAADGVTYSFAFLADEVASAPAARAALDRAAAALASCGCSRTVGP